MAPSRGGWTPLAVGLFQAVVAAMLVLGLGEDLYEIFLDGVPGATPDRLFLGPDYDTLVERGGVWALLGVIPAALDLLITVLLVVSGAYLLGLVRHVAALRPLALICGLGVLDHLPYVPAAAADAFFSCYWFLLFAAFLRLAALFPRRLGPADLALSMSQQLDGRQWLRGILPAMRGIWLRGKLVWGVALLAGVLSWGVVDPEPTALSALGATVSLLSLGLLLWWIAAAARFTRIQYRLARGRERERLKGFFNASLTYLIGFATLVLAYLVTASYLSAVRPDDAAAVLWLELFIATAYQVLVAVAVGLLLLSIFRRRALDPGRIFRRINVYYATLIAGVPLYAFTEDVIKLGIEGVLPLSPGLATLAALSLTIPILLGPIREGLDRLFDRFAFSLAPLFESTAVLMSCDLSGYGALLASDRDGALRVSQRLRRATRTVARPNDGRVIRLHADDVLLEFQRPEDAIEAALQLGRRFQGPGQAPGARLRTAIHCGTVIPVRNGDLFGEGVHTVLRLRAAAEAGEICVSDAVVDAMEQPVGALEELTERTVAGTSHPVRCYRLERPGIPATG